jgi:hypothetical protein
MWWLPAGLRRIGGTLQPRADSTLPIYQNELSRARYGVLTSMPI